MEYPSSSEDNDDDEFPRWCRRRSVRRTFSNSSAPPQLSSRRDSLYTGGGTRDACDQDAQDDDHAMAAAAAAPYLLYAPSSPTTHRRFARRHGLCQFQLLRDAVQTTIDLTSSLDLTTTTTEPEANDPHATDFASGSTSSSTAATSTTGTSKRRQGGGGVFLGLPMITEDLQQQQQHDGLVHAHAEQDASGATSRKLSRTCFRPNPSSDALYTPDNTV